MKLTVSTAQVPKITVYHATAPTCWWSWGYEAAMNRLSLVYGNQIEICLMLSTVYEDLAHWMKDNEVTDRSWKQWAQESAKIMGIPIRTDYRSDNEPRSVLPASLAVLAAQEQGLKKAARYMRAVLRLSVVEGRDVTKRDGMLAAAREAGLDENVFLEDNKDEEARKAELERQGEGFPELPLGFYNIAVSDGANRTVILDNAFDTSSIEGAIDYLSDGRLTKEAPTDILGYLREHGPAPSTEIGRVFAIGGSGIEARLGGLEKSGKIEKISLAGAAHWQISKTK